MRTENNLMTQGKTEFLELGRPKAHPRNSSKGTNYRIEKEDAEKRDSRQVLHTLTNTLKFLAVLKNIGKILKVFKHWE